MSHIQNQRVLFFFKNWISLLFKTEVSHILYTNSNRNFPHVELPSARGSQKMSTCSVLWLLGEARSKNSLDAAVVLLCWNILKGCFGIKESVKQKCECVQCIQHTHPLTSQVSYFCHACSAECRLESYLQILEPFIWGRQPEEGILYQTKSPLNMSKRCALIFWNKKGGGWELSKIVTGNLSWNHPYYVNDRE